LGGEEGVDFAPVFDTLAVFEAEEDDAGDVDRTAGGRDALKGVVAGAGEEEADGELAGFFDEVVGEHGEIGERAKDAVVNGLYAVDAGQGLFY
jgi:hypothetical protein